MSSLNTETLSSTKRTRTYEGGNAKNPSPLIELKRAVLTCFLWENSFYESGNELAERIGSLVSKVSTQDLVELAIEARHDMNLRHVPLFLAVEMIGNENHKKSVRKLIPQIINRPDDLTELLSIYWHKMGRKKPIPHQLKSGIADALPRFDSYQLAKYQNKGGVKLKDLFNLVHPNPKSKEQEQIWKDLMNGGLSPAETWETKISEKGNTKDSWEELIDNKKLGAMALLRNLRNMKERGVSRAKISKALKEANYRRVLPFRFIAAAKQVPSLEQEIEKAFFSCLERYPKLDGKTVVLVDISGSMQVGILSKKSDMMPLDAGCALAMIVRELASDVEVYAFHDHVFEIPPRHGFALRDAITEIGRGGTHLGKAIRKVEEDNPDLDRLIVFTDEQSHDAVPSPKNEKSYMINVGSYKPTVSYGKWISVTGFSEKIVDFIYLYEELERQESDG